MYVHPCQQMYDLDYTSVLARMLVLISALEDHEKSDLDPNQDHLPKSDLRLRSDPDLT